MGASRGLLGRLGGLLARLTPVEAALGASLGRVGGLLERFTAVLGPSWEPLGRCLGPLRPTWGPLGGFLGCLRAIFEASNRPLCPSWAVGNPNRRKPQNPSKASGKSMALAPSGFPGRPLGALVGRLGGFLGRLEALLGRLGGLLSRPGAIFGRFGAVLGHLGALLEPSLGPFGPPWTLGSPNRRAC